MYRPPSLGHVGARAPLARRYVAGSQERGQGCGIRHVANICLATFENGALERLVWLNLDGTVDVFRYRAVSLPK